MKKTAVILAIFIFCSHYITTFADVQAPNISSKSILIASANTSQVLYQKNADEKFAPGALVHILTAIISLEKGGDLERLIEVTADMERYIKPGDSLVGLKVGEKHTLRNLVFSMLIGNGDDAAVVLALSIGEGNMETFLEMMNARATELGATNSHFITPKGESYEQQYSTATDMAKIYRKAFSMPTLNAAIKTQTFVLPATNLAESRPMRTNNYCADNYLQTKYFSPSVVGGKTGYDGTSVCNAVQFAARDGVEVLCVVMGGEKIDDNITSLLDARTGIQFVYDNFESKNTVPLGSIQYDAKIKGAKGRDRLNLVADDSLSVFVEKGDTEGVKIDVKTEKTTFRAPIYVGQVLGEATVTYKGGEIAKIPLVSADDIPATALGAFGSSLGVLFNSWLFKALIIFGVMWFGYRTLYLEPKRRREARKAQRRRIAEERHRRGL